MMYHDITAKLMIMGRSSACLIHYEEEKFSNITLELSIYVYGMNRLYVTGSRKCVLEYLVRQLHCQNNANKDNN